MSVNCFSASLLTIKILFLQKTKTKLSLRIVGASSIPVVRLHLFIQLSAQWHKAGGW